MKIQGALKFLLITLLVVVSLGIPAHAQETTGNIAGLVKDQTGATISGASITVSDPSRGFQRTFQTTDDGTFNATDLPASVYTITVEMQGFKKYVSDLQ